MSLETPKEKKLHNNNGDEFYSIEINAKGDCAYEAYYYGDSSVQNPREHAQQKIVKYIVDSPEQFEIAKKILKPALKDILLDSKSGSKFIQFLSSNKRLDSDTLSALQETWQSYVSQNPEQRKNDPSLTQNSKELADSILLYAENQAFIKAFIEYDIERKLESDGYGHSCTLKLLAVIENKELHIWNDNNSEVSVELGGNIPVSNSQGRIDLNFTKAAADAPYPNHYERLTTSKADAENAKQARKPSPPPSQNGSPTKGSPKNSSRGDGLPSSSSGNTTTTTTTTTTLSTATATTPIAIPTTRSRPTPSSSSSRSNSSRRSVVGSPLSPQTAGRNAQQLGKEKDDDQSEQKSTQNTANSLKSPPQTRGVHNPNQFRNKFIGRIQSPPPPPSTAKSSEEKIGKSDKSGKKNDFFVSDDELFSPKKSIDTDIESSASDDDEEAIDINIKIESELSWLKEAVKKTGNSPEVQKFHNKKAEEILSLIDTPNFKNSSDKYYQIIYSLEDCELYFGVHSEEITIKLLEKRMQELQVLAHDDTNNISDNQKIVASQLKDFPVFNANFAINIINSETYYNKFVVFLLTIADSEDRLLFFGESSLEVELGLRFKRLKFLQSRQQSRINLAETDEQYEEIKNLQHKNRKLAEKLLKMEEFSEAHKKLLTILGSKEQRELCFGSAAGDYIAIRLKYKYLESYIEQLKVGYLKAFHDKQPVEQYKKLLSNEQQKSFTLANEILANPAFTQADDELLKIIIAPEACELFFGEDKDKILALELKLSAKKIKHLVNEQKNDPAKNNSVEIARLQNENKKLADKITNDNKTSPESYEILLSLMNSTDIGADLIFGKPVSGTEDEARIVKIMLDRYIEQKAFSKFFMILAGFVNNSHVNVNAYYWSAYTHISKHYANLLKEFDYDFVGKQQQLIDKSNHYIKAIREAANTVIGKASNGDDIKAYSEDDKKSLIRNEIVNRFGSTDEFDLITQLVKQYHQATKGTFRFVSGDRDDQVLRIENLKKEYSPGGKKSIREAKYKLEFIQKLRDIQLEIEKEKGKKHKKSALWKELDNTIVKLKGKNTDAALKVLKKNDPTEVEALFALIKTEKEFKAFFDNRIAFADFNCDRELKRLRSILNNNGINQLLLVVFMTRDNANVVNAGIDLYLEYLQNNSQNQSLSTIYKDAILVSDSILSSDAVDAKSKNSYKKQIFNAYLNAAHNYLTAEVSYKKRSEEIMRIEQFIKQFGNNFPVSDKQINMRLATILESYLKSFGEEYLAEADQQKAQGMLDSLISKNLFNNTGIKPSPSLFIGTLLDPYGYLTLLVEQQALSERNLRKERGFVLDLKNIFESKDPLVQKSIQNLSPGYYKKLNSALETYFKAILKEKDANKLKEFLESIPFVELNGKEYGSVNDVKSWSTNYFNFLAAKVKGNQEYITAYNFYNECLELSTDKPQVDVQPVDSLQVNLMAAENDISNPAHAKKATKLDKTQVNLMMIKSHISIYSPAKKAMKDVNTAFSKLLDQDGSILRLRAGSSRLIQLKQYIDELLELKKYPSMNKEISTYLDTLRPKFQQLYDQILNARLEVSEAPKFVPTPIEKMPAVPVENTFYLYVNKEGILKYRAKNVKKSIPTAWAGGEITKGALGYPLNLIQRTNAEEKFFNYINNNQDMSLDDINECNKLYSNMKSPSLIQHTYLNTVRYFLYMGRKNVNGRPQFQQVHEDVFKEPFIPKKTSNSSSTTIVPPEIRVDGSGQHKALYAAIKEKANYEGKDYGPDFTQGFLAALNSKDEKVKTEAREELIRLAKTREHYISSHSITADSFQLIKTDSAWHLYYVKTANAEPIELTFDEIPELAEKLNNIEPAQLKANEKLLSEVRNLIDGHFRGKHLELLIQKKELIEFIDQNAFQRIFPGETFEFKAYLEQKSKAYAYLSPVEISMMMNFYYNDYKHIPAVRIQYVMQDVEISISVILNSSAKDGRLFTQKMFENVMLFNASFEGVQGGLKSEFEQAVTILRDFEIYFSGYLDKISGSEHTSALSYFLYFQRYNSVGEINLEDSNCPPYVKTALDEINGFKESDPDTYKKLIRIAELRAALLKNLVKLRFNVVKAIMHDNLLLLDFNELKLFFAKANVKTNPEYQCRQYWVNFIKRKTAQDELSGTQIFCNVYLSKLTLQELDDFFTKALSADGDFIEKSLLEAISTQSEEDKKIIIKYYDQMTLEDDYFHNKKMQSLQKAYNQRNKLCQLLKVENFQRDAIPYKEISYDENSILNQKPEIIHNIVLGNMLQLVDMVAWLLEHPASYKGLFDENDFSSLCQLFLSLVSDEFYWSVKNSVPEANKNQFQEKCKKIVEHMLYKTGSNGAVYFNELFQISDSYTHSTNTDDLNGGVGSLLFSHSGFGSLLPDDIDGYYFEVDKRLALQKVEKRISELKGETTGIGKLKFQFMENLRENMLIKNDRKSMLELFNKIENSEKYTTCLTDTTGNVFKEMKSIFVAGSNVGASNFISPAKTNAQLLSSFGNPGTPSSGVNIPRSSPRPIPASPQNSSNVTDYAGLNNRNSNSPRKS